MRHDENNITGDSDASDASNGTADADLGAALSGGDSEFVVTEEKKPIGRGTLALFGIVIAAVAGLYFMHARSGPDAAVASAETVAANETINQFLASGDQNAAKMQALIRDTEKIVAQFLQYPSMKQVPLSDLRTNPFRRSTTDGTSSAESLSESDSKRQKELERQAALKSVQGLQLQSIMHSDKSRACMVNNTLYQEGQQIESFVIETINPHSVVVRSGAFRFELKMQR